MGLIECSICHLESGRASHKFIIDDQVVCSACSGHHMSANAAGSVTQHPELAAILALLLDCEETCKHNSDRERALQELFRDLMTDATQESAAMLAAIIALLLDCEETRKHNSDRERALKERMSDLMTEATQESRKISDWHLKNKQLAVAAAAAAKANASPSRSIWSIWDLFKE